MRSADSFDEEEVPKSANAFLHRSLSACASTAQSSQLPLKSALIELGLDGLQLPREQG